MSSPFRINGALTNPGIITAAVYANQNNEFVTDDQDNQIMYYENGAPTSSDALTFDGSEFVLNASNFSITNTGTAPSSINGYLKINGTTEITGAIGQDGGNANLAIGPNPLLVATPGPRLLYRNNTMPLYWTDSFNVDTGITFGTFIGGVDTREYITVNGKSLFAINGPYVSTANTTTIVVSNANPTNSYEFYPAGAFITDNLGGTLSSNSKAERICIYGVGNNNTHQVNVGIIYYPPLL